MKLWEIDQRIEQILHETQDEMGVLSDQAANELNELGMKQEEKILNCGLVLMGHMTEAKAIKDIAKQMLARAKQHENKAEWLRGYMESHAPSDPKFEIKDPRVVVKWTKSKRVDAEILIESVDGMDSPDFDQIDPRFVKTKTIKTIDKAGARKLMLKGEFITGLVMRESQALKVVVGPKVKDDE